MNRQTGIEAIKAEEMVTRVDVDRRDRIQEMLDEQGQWARVSVYMRNDAGAADFLGRHFIADAMSTRDGHHEFILRHSVITGKIIVFDTSNVLAVGSGAWMIILDQNQVTF